MKKNIFSQVFADSGTNNVALYVADPKQADSLRMRIIRHFAGKYSLLIYTTRSVREEALDIFDQTFAITYALQLIAIVVAATGVASTLFALVLERSREIGILKAIGATPAQLRGITLIQAALMGIASEGRGIGAGLALS